MEEKLLALPWQIQIAIGSGYAAYLIAYAGIRDHHKATDITFRSIAFGMVATLIILITDGSPKWIGLPLAFAFTVFAGAVWRRFGIALTRKAMRDTDVSWSDDTPSAWATVTVCNAKHFVSQISVQLEDGTWLRCIDTRPFTEKPFGPMTIGVNGDVALYVTHEESPDGSQTEVVDVIMDYWGARITYVPASKIRRVAIRHSGP